MPEIGEVARVVHYLKKHLVGRRITNVLVQEDDIIYGKVGTSASAFQKAMTGKKILDARQQGKYFWLVADSPPHPVMHLGMTGWVKFNNDDSAYYKPAKEDTDWPPRFWKFVLQTDAEDKGEVAFVDARRLARIRLVDVPAEELRKTSPLKENGPDPVVDKDLLTVEWLGNKMRSKKVPIKALLLDQANISGVGNWVADEVLYQANIHPEQYSNTFSDEQIETLHHNLMYVTGTAVDTLSESSKFPADWLMKHRWGKGKKDGNTLPNGEKITFLTVGGRTSAVVLSRQKKTGAVPDAAIKAEREAEAEDDEDGAEDVEEKKPAKGRGKRKSNGLKKEIEETLAAIRERSRRAAGQSNGVKSEEDQADSGAEVEDEKPPKKKSKTKAAVEKVVQKVEETTGRRRSARLK
ncbi:formamidopyrimidine-DNA glycosylase [Elsinoe ampelina]|uniref:Formamidopyrimidine-DNA glycosylase n=1 Tax=Elsinoe ampelina TaxID=302913 RepID=A0A6A6GCC9_9PEZI|nr:formamidopyrimidine-DNA glycosylase [Elsinoe ampelina]